MSGFLLDTNVGDISSSPLLNHKIFRAGMVDHDGRSGLLRLQQEAGGQAHADIFFRMEQREQLGLVLQIGTCRIAERIARAAILLVEQIANVRRIFSRDAQLLAHLLVEIFGQGFGGLDAEPVQVEVLGVLPGFEELLRFYRCPGAHCD